MELMKQNLRILMIAAVAALPAAVNAGDAGIAKLPQFHRPLDWQLIAVDQIEVRGGG